MSGNQRSPYDVRRSPTALHFRSSYSSDGQNSRLSQYDPTTPVHAHSPVAYNASNHSSTRLPLPTNTPSSSSGTFYDPTQAERSESNSSWSYSGYPRQSSQSHHSPIVGGQEFFVPPNFCSHSGQQPFGYRENSLPSRSVEPGSRPSFSIHSPVSSNGIPGRLESRVMDSKPSYHEPVSPSSVYVRFKPNSVTSACLCTDNSLEGNPRTPP